MDHFIDAFEDRDIRGMIRLCRICPRVFDEPFETDRYRGISASAIVLAVAIQNVDMVRALAGLLVEWGYNPTLVYDIDNGSPSSTLLIKAAEYGSYEQGGGPGNGKLHALKIRWLTTTRRPRGVRNMKCVCVCVVCVWCARLTSMNWPIEFF
jgi:hypothetical protein